MSNCVNRVGPFCSLGLFKSKPEPGDCASCGSYSGPSRGLGDRIDTITSKTGIKSVVKTISAKTGKPCGCGKRRAALNKAFPTRDQ